MELYYINLIPPLIFFVAVPFLPLYIATLAAMSILLLPYLVHYYQTRNDMANDPCFIALDVNFIPSTAFLIARQMTDPYTAILIMVGASILLSFIMLIMLWLLKKTFSLKTLIVHDGALIMYAIIAFLAQNSHFILWERDMAYALLLLSSLFIVKRPYPIKQNN